MKKNNWIVALATLSFTLFGSCAGAPHPVSGLVSLDEAIAGIAASVEGKAEANSTVAILKIDSPLQALSGFLADELSGSLSASGAFKTLVRGDAINVLEGERQLQMSGLVDDKSAVGIGHYLGAKVALTGSFSRFANFSRLVVRVIDVETAELLGVYRANIAADDPALAGITAPLKSVRGGVVTEKALEYMDRGKDFLAEGLYDPAIEALGWAIAENARLAEAYVYRGGAYNKKKMYDKAIADYSAALRIDPNNTSAYTGRAESYVEKGGYDKAIADYSAALRINPNNASAYTDRAYAYGWKGDNDRAIADCGAALRIDPNNARAYLMRGMLYDGIIKKDYDKAIADYSAALRINPNYFYTYTKRAEVYAGQGDYYRAVDDYTEALRIDPNNVYAYISRAEVYLEQYDYDEAIADYNAALRLDPGSYSAKRGLEEARKAKAEWDAPLPPLPEDIWGYFQ